MSGVILYDVKDRIATVTLNRPERLNALNPELDGAIIEALHRAEADPGVHCVVLQGAGRAFCAGADTKRDESSGQPRNFTPIEDRDRLEASYRRYMQIWDLKIPVIAKVHGYCLGRGTQLAVICDITYVADDTVIGAPQLPLGAGWNSVFWAWHLGPKKAKEIFLPVGDTISGTEAAELGIFNGAFPPDQLDQHVDEYAHKLARVPKELLGLEKLAINKTQDIQGFREAIAVGFEIDVIGHLSESVLDVNRRIRENGLRPTIEAWKAGEF
jgi:enoyl-CoA hydratase